MGHLRRTEQKLWSFYCDELHTSLPACLQPPLHTILGTDKVKSFSPCLMQVTFKISESLLFIRNKTKYNVLT